MTRFPAKRRQHLMRQIIPGIYVFTGLTAGRVYLLQDPDSLTLIDAGLASAPPRVAAQLNAAGHALTDVKRILITHAHPDHVDGLPALKRMTGAQVIASTQEKPVIEGEIPAPRPRRGLIRVPSAMVKESTQVDRAVEDGEVLDEVLGGVRVILVPGHTPGHVAFWQPDRRVLFCGDVIINVTGLSLPPAPVTFDMIENRRSVQRLAALNASVVCFGHGPALTRDAARALHRFAQRVKPGR
jgi:glyoxylase-like metal-dependent hydrolase (beta-lactamase superfamily II)